MHVRRAGEEMKQDTVTLIPGQMWSVAKDGDMDAMRLMRRHYSWYEYRDNRPRRLFVGPGDKLVLVSPMSDAVFVWRKFIDDCPLSKDVNCAAFRNESGERSSDMIREAMDIAWNRWPGAQLYTYVNPAKIRSKNPGCCFKKAGWSYCGITAGGLYVLEIKSPVRK